MRATVEGAQQNQGGAGPGAGAGLGALPPIRVYIAERAGHGPGHGGAVVVKVLI